MAFARRDKANADGFESIQVSKSGEAAVEHQFGWQGTGLLFSMFDGRQFRIVLIVFA